MRKSIKHISKTITKLGLNHNTCEGNQGATHYIIHYMQPLTNISNTITKLGLNHKNAIHKMRNYKTHFKDHNQIDIKP